MATIDYGAKPQILLPGPGIEKGARPLRVRHPIGVKLQFIILAILFVSLGTITVLVSYMVSSDVRITAEDNNFTINNRVAAGLSNTLSSVRAASAVFLATMGAVEAGEARTRALEKLFFENNYDIAAVALLDGGGGGKAPAFTATTPVSKDMNRLEAPV